MEMRKKVSQSLVVWSWFKRCLIGLPPMSLLLSITHNDFSWTQHFWKTRSPEELSNWMPSVNTWSRAALPDSVGGRMRWGSAFVVQVQLLDKCLALTCLMCPLMTTELPTENTIVDLALCTHILLCSPWLLLYPGILILVFCAVNGGSSADCRGRGPGPPQTLFPLDVEIKQQTLTGNLHILSAYFFLDSWEGP